MKKFLLASAFATSLIFGLPAAAQAHKVGIQVFFGYPHYSYRVGPGYVFRPGYGWYHPSQRYSARISCAEAKWSVRNRGYRNVSTIECGGSTYTFQASRNGYRRIVYVNARTGAVWRG